MSNPVINLENVSWAYTRARDWALKNINISIGEGECIAVMGENGAGKTTLCRLLNGLIPHSLPGKLLGKVTVDGIVTASSTVARLAGKVGMAFEDPETQLFTASVADEAAFALENLLLPAEAIRKKVEWALGIAGLSAYADYAPSTLSGGQKQRLAIACALAMATKVLVLDEPCSQLDPAGAREVLSVIRELRAHKGLTVVMATSSIDEAAEFADRVCVLHNGNLAAFDTPRRIFADRALLEKTGVCLPPVNRPVCPVPLDSGCAIQISGLSYRYEPGRKILDNITCTIAEHEFTAVTGHNGSGKTTLLKNISGLLRPPLGSVLLRGTDTVKMKLAEIAGEIGFVMQDPDRQLFESTVYNEIAFTLKRSRLTKKEIQEKTEELLQKFGLEDKRDAFPPALGRADRVKIVFASVLAMGPRIIMLDEPIAGQDQKGCRLIMDTLAELHRQGCTIVMVTHNEKIAAEYAQRIMVMRDGRIYG
jgi:energy-coupling factor transport system ATP-binding protein